MRIRKSKTFDVNTEETFPAVSDDKCTSSQYSKREKFISWGKAKSSKCKAEDGNQAAAVTASDGSGVKSENLRDMFAFRQRNKTTEDRCVQDEKEKTISSDYKPKNDDDKDDDKATNDQSTHIEDHSNKSVIEQADMDDDNVSSDNVSINKFSQHVQNRRDSFVNYCQDVYGQLERKVAASSLTSSKKDQKSTNTSVKDLNIQDGKGCLSSDDDSSVNNFGDDLEEDEVAKSPTAKKNHFHHFRNIVNRVRNNSKEDVIINK